MAVDQLDSHARPHLATAGSQAEHMNRRNARESVQKRAYPAAKKREKRETLALPHEAPTPSGESPPDKRASGA